jgi:hypothetical protein
VSTLEALIENDAGMAEGVGRMEEPDPHNLDVALAIIVGAGDVCDD